MSTNAKTYLFDPDISLPADAGTWKRRRMTSGETGSFMRIYAAQDSWDTAIEQLERRICETKGCKQAVATATAMIHKAFQLLLRTMEPEQVRSLRRNLDHMKHEIVIIGATKVNHLDGDGVWISERQLAILVQAARERCDVCDLDRQQQRKCLLAKTLDSIPRLKGDDTDPECRGCRYFSNWIQG